MHWLLGLPFLALFACQDIKTIAFYFAAYLIVCLYIQFKSKNRFTLRHSFAFYVKPCFDSIFSFISAFLFSVLFCVSFKKTDFLSFIANKIHLPSLVFLCATSALVFVCTFISLRLITDKVKGYSISKETNNNCVCDKTLGFLNHLLLFCCALIVITICSKSSPLYPLNDWVDSNCFFTVGKSMLSGKVPYRDLFEQKGPILYAIHAIAALISYDSFLGVWIIEILCCYAFLVFSFKTLRLFRENVPILLMPFVAAIVYTGLSFAHGDSAEEICLPLLSYALYVGLKSIMCKQAPSIKECFIVGITSACVLWVKYTMLGFYLGWIVVPIYYTIRNKDYKSFIKMISSIFAGVISVSVIVVLYFALNNALGDLFEVYFYNNIFNYSSLTTKNHVIIRLIMNVLNGLCRVIKYNAPSIILISVIMLRIGKNKQDILSYILSTLSFLLISTYGGGSFYDYYAFSFSLFIPIGIFNVWDVLYGKLSVNTDTKKSHFCLKTISSIIACAVILCTCENLYLIFTPKNELPQYKFKYDIENSGVDNPTLLNLNFLDGGFYTATGIVPNTKYFCMLNVSSDKIYEYQCEYVKNGEIDFIVTRDTIGSDDHTFSNYTEIDSATFYFSKANWIYRLYIRNN